jgi:hypothetical protein
MEQKEYVRDVYAEAEESSKRRRADEAANNGKRRNAIEKIINRLALGRRDLGGIREVLAKHTPDEIVEMFERPAQDNDCLHMKGGKIRSPNADYAIRVHTFVDGHANVKCTICGKEWETADPLAIYMMERTTNHPSSSEVIIPPVSLAVRTARWVARIEEAQIIMSLLNDGLTEKGLKLRIQSHKDSLKKLGEENAASNR